MSAGIAQLPGFEASLALLVRHEQYSLTDIAMMFGVSRERIRQLCERLGFDEASREREKRGLYALRVWDDAANRFTPINRAAFETERRRKTTATRKAARIARIHERRAAIGAQLRALRGRLGRTPTYVEMYREVRLGCETRPTSAAARVLGWFRNGAYEDYRSIFARFHSYVGFRAREAGSPGHLSPRIMPTVCLHGHTDYRVTPKGHRYCAACERERHHRRRSVPHSPHSDTLRKP